MAGRKKQPVDLIVMKGKSHHITKTEYADRKAAEITAPSDEITAPAYLTQAQRKEFDRLANQLTRIGIMTNLDCNILADYIVSHDEWVRSGKDYEAERRAALDGGRVDEDSLKKMVMIAGIRDKAFKQAIRCASELGLTITSRCKLVAPKVEEKPENKFARFG